MALLLGSGAGLCASAQAPEGPMTPEPGTVIQPMKADIKVRTILVNTPVTVRNPAGEMVLNLEPHNFRVTDNGEEQKISHFDLGGDPISLVVVIENSSRLEPLLPELRKTGILVTQTVMGPNGEAAVIAFNDSVDKLLGFTSDTDAVEKTVSRLKEGTAGARLYDAMNLGIEMLSGRPVAKENEAGRRRVMLILAESHDLGSDAKLGAVLRQAQLANVAIYSVGLSGTKAALEKKPEYKRPPNPAPDGTFGLPPIPGTVQTPTTENQRYGNIDLMALALWAIMHVKDEITDHGLETAAVATGGTHLSTWKDRSIEKAIDEIGGELHSQYSLSYTPTDAHDTGYHEIKVDVDRKDLKVRARPGYYLATPGT